MAPRARVNRTAGGRGGRGAKEPSPRDRNGSDQGARRPRDRDDLGGEQIEGKRAVLELLRAGRRRVRSVSISNRIESDDVIDEILDLAGSAVRMVGPERLGALARSEAHQGVVALAQRLQPVDIDDLFAVQHTFVVALDGVTDPGNLGAVLRTAETAGATGIILPRHRSARITPTVAKAAAGAVEYLPIALVGGIPTALDRAPRAGVWSVGLDGDGSVAIADVAVADQSVVLVLGAEGRGLAALTKKRCDVLARIDMAGRIESLNVSAAAAIATYEIARRRARS